MMEMKPDTCSKCAELERDVEYWKRQATRCGDDNVVISKQRAELEQENERLRAECGLRQIHGYREGVKRAAEIAEKFGRGYTNEIGANIAHAIRAEIGEDRNDYERQAT